MSTPTLGAIADELYGVPPAAFVATRDARAKEVAREIGVGVRALRRPAPAAWVVNLLVRERRDELDDLLALGADLRAAQSALDRAEITRLAKERRGAVTALAREGGTLADDAGHRVAPAVLDAVAATLDAGLADPEAAEAIRTGRLLRPLQAIGFEPVDLAEAVALPDAGSRAAEKRAPARPRLRAVDDTDAELARAKERADAAVARAESEAAAAAAELDGATARLRDARAALAAAQREADAAEQARDAATDAHDRAAGTLETARRRRRDLG
jgi:hypothetical protein